MNNSFLRCQLFQYDELLNLHILLIWICVCAFYYFFCILWWNNWRMFMVEWYLHREISNAKYICWMLFCLLYIPLFFNIKSNSIKNVSSLNRTLRLQVNLKAFSLHNFIYFTTQIDLTLFQLIVYQTIRKSITKR